MRGNPIQEERRDQTFPQTIPAQTVEFSLRRKAGLDRLHAHLEKWLPECGGQFFI